MGNGQPSSPAIQASRHLSTPSRTPPHPIESTGPTTPTAVPVADSPAVPPLTPAALDAASAATRQRLGEMKLGGGNDHEEDDDGGAMEEDTDAAAPGPSSGAPVYRKRDLEDLMRIVEDVPGATQSRFEQAQTESALASHLLG